MPPVETEQPIYLPKAEYLRPMSLGFANVLADVLWFRTISYFGTHYRSNRLYPWLAHMCDLVTDLDPRAEHVYRFAGVILPWEAGEADQGIRLLEKGIRVFPDSWIMHYWLGFNYYFFKSDFKQAAFYLRRAAELPDAHPNAAKLAALLYTKQYGAETASEFLREMERNTDDPQMQEVVRRHLVEAQLSDGLESLSQAVTAYKERFGHFPHSTARPGGERNNFCMPLEPFGGSYRLDAATGEVTSSSGQVPSRLHESPLRRKLLHGATVRDL
jgi:tetratricopeptide (TPR) repeat protein